MTDSSYHTPIMLREVLELMEPARCRATIDGTLGGGGHSEGILELLPETSVHFGIDRDPEALAAAGARLSRFSNFHAVHGNFFDMKELIPLGEYGLTGVDGILLDLGVSSHQLDDGSRGFSYNMEAPLDMRMDKTAPLSAYEVHGKRWYRQRTAHIRSSEANGYALSCRCPPNHDPHYD